ncbi:MAG: gliding motility-associated C-terminal domain-containing protein [Saprospiraceae bacterium]|nr:gliding motility-associated C-terminal domain-containing protein [Saprospiraceae bacterium]
MEKFRFGWFFGFFLLLNTAYSQQIYTVNSANDADDGVCDAVHCSLREAINASNTDGVVSEIRFNIPGAGPHTINPGGAFPDVTAAQTSILGESQAGGAGSIIVNLNFRVLGGNPFFRILGSGFYMSGVSFRNMNFDAIGDHILEFGNATIAADSGQVYNCAFYQDAATTPNTTTHSVKLTRGMDITIRKCTFGSDFTRSSILITRGMIAIGASMGLGNSYIDSCTFVTNFSCIEARSSQCLITNNLFGALDTSKVNAFLDPSYAIRLYDGGIYTMNNNFFYGQKIVGIQTNDLLRTCTISNNRFYNGTLDIELNGTSNSDYFVRNNYARDGGDFINVNAMGAYSLFLNHNSISRYSNVYVNFLDPGISQARHFNNHMTCLSGRAVLLNNANTPKPSVPVINSVNRDQIRGTGNPNDSVCVYANPSLLCPGSTCHAGFELGRTRSDATGAWTLNVAYPNRHTISAYQYPSNPADRPNIYSEFSNCYVCPGPVRTVFSPTICIGETVNFRNRTYSSTNPTDSFNVNGDGVSICDSVFIVDVKIAGGSRTEHFVNVCYQDTVSIGSVRVFEGKLADSVTLQTQNGCDSIVVVFGTIRGLFTLNQTICNTDRLTIGTEIFDKDRPTGIAILPGGSTFGCDSVIFVNLTIKNFAESNYNTAICKGQTITINGEIFSESKTTGVQTLTSGSVNGCDSVINVFVHVADPTFDFRLTLCPSDSVLIGGAGGRYFGARNPSGQFILQNGSYLGCDSIINVSLTLRTEGMGTFRAVICRTDTLTLGGQRFSSGRTMGTLRFANQSANGCDSLVNVIISILPDAVGSLDTFTCMGSTINIGGTVFSESRPNGDINLPRMSYQGCDSFLTVNVRFLPLPVSTFNPTICSKDSIRVGNQVFSILRPSGSVVIPRSPAQGCDSTIQVNLSFAAPIVPTIEVENILCQTPNTGVVQINDIGVAPGPYMISVDGQPPVSYIARMRFTGLSQGNHNLRILNSIGCDTVVNFTVNPSPILTLDLPQDTTIQLGGTVAIRPNFNFTPSLISWTPPSDLSCLDCTNPIATPQQTTTYTLKLTDSNGCEIEDQFTIFVKVPEADVYIPNVFSPNGDGVNEFFEVTFRFPDKSQLLVMRIFDRWGSLVFEQTGNGIGDQVKWDGTTKGRDLLPGVYTYALQFITEGNEPQWRHGDITIIR